MLVYEKAKPLGGTGLNYEIVGGPNPPITFKKENTIWVNTNQSIDKHYFSYNEPMDDAIITNSYIFGGSTASSDYIGGWSNGNACSVSESQITCGTDGWIRTTEKIDVTNIDVIEAHLYIQQTYESEIYIALGDSYGYKYTGTQHCLLPVLNGEAKEGVYKTIALDVSTLTGSYYICLSHRGYGSSYWRWIKGKTIINNAPVGAVWIQTDINRASVGFDAIKKNELMVYPYKLKQWDNTRWKQMSGILYNKGATTFVFNAGVPLYTYGAQNVAWKALGSGGSSGSTTFEESSVTIKAKGSYSNSARYQNMYTTNKIDLTNYTTIKAIVSGYALNNEGNLASATNGYFYMGIAETQVAKLRTESVLATNINPLEKNENLRTVELDISNISGEYYIGICVMAYRINDAINTGHVYSVWLE